MGNEPAIPQFSADQPLSNPADDKLNRDRFSTEIARSIANWSGRDSLVVSLTGEWGSGKSTIKNFVSYHLKNKAYVLEFNPWQWSGQDKLLEAFLWQLGELFGKEARVLIFVCRTPLAAFLRAGNCAKTNFHRQVSYLEFQIGWWRESGKAGNDGG